MHVKRCNVLPSFFSEIWRGPTESAQLLTRRNGGRRNNVHTCLLGLLVLGVVQSLAGCGANSFVATPTAAITKLSGTLHGGNQPVTGSHVFLYAVNATTTRGSSQSLLNSPGYVTTDGNGNFTITSDYTCTSGQYVYLLAIGGNPGLTPTPPATTVNNTELALASGIGACPLSSGSVYNIDEVTTVATAYALAQFATSDIQIGAASAYATGIANAFGNIPNIVNLATGVSLATTPSGNGNVPNTTLNSLANSLASCVNSTGTGSACTQLMSDANVTGANGTPVDTFQAALNVAQNPGVKVSNIFNDAQANAPFQPSLTGAPSDWSITVQYLGAANPTLASSTHTCYDSGTKFTDICQAQGMAIDSFGNVWITNYNPDYNGGNGAVSFEQGNVVKFSPAGAEVSPAGGYTAPYLYRLQQIAFDTNNVAWVGTRATTVGTTAYKDAVVSVGQNGTVQSFTGGGISNARAVAVDAYNNVWAAGQGVIAEFTNAGTAVSGTGYTNSSLMYGTFKMAFDHLGNAWIISYNSTNYSPTLTEFTPASHAMNLMGTYGGAFTQAISPTTGAISQGLAIDASNNIWFSNAYTSAPNGNANGSGFLAEYSNTGTLLSGAGVTNGGVLYPNDVAIDGSGNVFSLDSPLGEVSSTGAAIAPAGGYQSPNGNDCCFTGAVDNSGNLWLTGGIGIYQVIGIASPVITPIAATLGVH